MKRIYNAFFFSLAGLRWAAGHEAAVRQELAVLAAAIPAAFLLAMRPWQVPLLIGAVVFVIIIELLNTGIEKLCDHVRPERHDDIRIIKDTGSAACFLAQLLAASVWLTVAALRLAG